MFCDWTKSVLLLLHHDVSSNSDAVILCYGVDNEASFKNCYSVWRREIEEYAGDDAVVILVGCKGDINKLTGRGNVRKVSLYDGQTMAKDAGFKKLRCLWGECSAKTGANVESVFRTVAEEVLQRKCRSAAPKPNVKTAMVSVAARTKPLCICGRELHKYQVQFAYPGNAKVCCDECEREIEGKEALIYHCPDGKKNSQHRNGYDLCIECGDKQLQFDELRGVASVTDPPKKRDHSKPRKRARRPRRRYQSVYRQQAVNLEANQVNAQPSRSGCCG